MWWMDAASGFRCWFCLQDKYHISGWCRHGAESKASSFRQKVPLSCLFCSPSWAVGVVYLHLSFISCHMLAMEPKKMSVLNHSDGAPASSLD